jgi:hypothetical protein
MVESSKISTDKGLISFGDIKESTNYLSFDPYVGFCWAEGIAPYPKQKDDLYRVIHEHGEFVASLSHGVFCADYMYRPLGEISVGCELISSSQIHQQTIPEFSPSKFYSNVLRYFGTDEDYQDDYLKYFHQYDPQLRFYPNIDRFFFPSHIYAQAYADISCYFEPFWRFYDQAGQKSKHIHPYRQIVHQPMMSFAGPAARPVFYEATHVPNNMPEHISENIQQSGRSLLTNEGHQKDYESDQYYKPYKTKVLHIEKTGKDWVWDTHVFGTNNYISSGAIHHNSGKSYALCHKILKLSMINKDIPGGFMSPTLKEFKRDCLPIFEEILDTAGVKFHYNKTDLYFQFPWTKGKLYVVSGETKIRGPNWGYAGVNELTLIDLVRYKEIIGRVRVRNAKCPQICSVGTPEGYTNEYYEYMIEKPRHKFRIIYGSTKDNEQNLGEDYIESLRSSYDTAMQQAYIEGLWINMSGNRFYYSYDPKRNDDPTIEEIDWQQVHVGLDFNVSPMAATVWQFREGKLFCFDEITLYDADTKKMCDALKSRGYTPDRTILYPDPSGKARSTKGDPDIKILEDYGGFTEIRFRTKAPGFRMRQLNTNNLFEKGLIKIHPDKAPRLRKDFMAVEQDKVSLEKIKDNLEYTHHSDGFDYLCDILFPFSGKKPTVHSVTVR